MTNEEKARELAFESPQCQMYIDNKCNQNFACDRFKVALKMAKWKDEQIVRLFNFVNSYLSNDARNEAYNMIKTFTK
jgi:hypothetical protein